ncbi:hypothetical protein TBK1r_18210 [Stieleria magnilauensis]|uniref:Uncharacterized protein n=1 Tax=Stieleria magnilauensis TaxID=2527963 RepID=A0ABX5XLM4_9BACT|nr:hypothetical protein TBK1r_18210 [Planctomycetes bacterium TBK1r]
MGAKRWETQGRMIRGRMMLLAPEDGYKNTKRHNESVSLQADCLCVSLCILSLLCRSANC